MKPYEKKSREYILLQYHGLRKRKANLFEECLKIDKELKRKKLDTQKEIREIDVRLKKVKQALADKDLHETK